jgi:phosphoglycolate phosphatase-like HAD superfamily hydrolase
MSSALTIFCTLPVLDSRAGTKQTSRLPMMHPLLEVKNQVAKEASQRKVAVVFDLDSTLFCVSPRTQFLLRSLSQQVAFRQRFAEAALILENIEVRPTDWGIREALERTALRPSVEAIRAMRDHWRSGFFSSRFLDKDILYPKALEYVRGLHELGAQVWYLTGRDQLNMREGTVRVLKQHGFPLVDEARLLMKPDQVEEDEHFKVSALRTLSGQLDHIWFFENEPVIIHEVQAALPNIEIVYVDSTHSRRASAPLGLRTIAPDYSVGVNPD